MTQSPKKYDLVIIGAGPAGLTAAIYAARRKLKTLVVSKNMGGQMAMTNEIENYPGFDFITGFELTDKMKNQAQKWGAEVLLNIEVTKIEKSDDGFLLKTFDQDFEARAIILAFGLTPRSLNVPGEQELRNRGVSYCATCDGPLFKDKVISVVGGGNSGMEAAEYLSKIAKKVYLFHIRDVFKAEPYLLSEARKAKNINFYCHSKVTEIKGDKKVDSIVVTDVNDENKTEEFKVDGVFVEIGYEAKIDWLKDFVKLNNRGEIEVSKDCETSVAGIFAAGDCTDITYKQIIISAGEGSKAALKAYKYLVATNSSGAIAPDWGHCDLIGTKNKAKIKTG